MGKSSGGGDTTTTIRYAPYIETDHQLLLNQTVIECTKAIYNSPYANLTAGIDVDVVFTGGILPPTAWQMFQNYILDFDIESQAVNFYNDALASNVAAESVKSQADLLDNELTMRVLPRMKAKMRDIGAVLSSGFIVAEAQLESEKLLAISKFATDMKMKVIDLAVEGVKLKANWNLQVMEQYNKEIQGYYQLKFMQLEKTISIGTSNILWPLTILDHARAILAAMTGATSSSVKGTQWGVNGTQMLAGLGGMAQVASMIGGGSAALTAAGSSIDLMSSLASVPLISGGIGADLSAGALLL